jgi:hypothetical protein
MRTWIFSVAILLIVSALAVGSTFDTQEEQALQDMQAQATPVIEYGPGWDKTYNPDGTISQVFYSRNINMPHKNGTWDRMTNVVNMTWENRRFKVSWYNRSFTLRPFIYTMNNNTFTVEQILASYPGIIDKGILQRDQEYKWGINFSNVPANLQDKVRYIVFKLVDSENLTWSDVSKDAENIYFPDGIKLNYNDLRLAGFNFSIINRTYLLIGNVTNKSELFLDPTISLYSGSNFIDTYIQNGDSSANGAANDLYSGDIGGNYMWILMKFNLTNITSNNKITHATLRLNTVNDGGVSNAYNHTIWQLNGSCWNESTTTWANFPRTNITPTPFAYAAYSDTGADDWYSWNISNMVQEWVTGNTTNYGFMINATPNLAGEYTRFDSSEAAEATARPQINITYVASNAAPSFNTLAISPTTAIKNTALNLTFNITDSNNDGLNITELCWFTNDNKNSTYCWANGSPFIGVTDALFYNNESLGVPVNKVVKGQDWLVQVNITDGTDSVVQNSSAVSISNTAPTVNTVSILPTTAQSDESLNVTFNVTDVDSIDNLNVTACWFTNDNLNTTFCYNFSSSSFVDVTKNLLYNNNSVGVNASFIRHNQEWLVQINVSDGTNKITQNSTAITITNKEPSQGLPTVNSTTKWNYTTENITCYNTSSADTEGYEVRSIFTWKKNGVQYEERAYTFDVNENNTITDYSKTLNATMQRYNNSKWDSVGATINWTDQSSRTGGYFFDRSELKRIMPGFINYSLTNKFTFYARVRPEGDISTIDSGGIVGSWINEHPDTFGPNLLYIFDHVSGPRFGAAIRNISSDLGDILYLGYTFTNMNKWYDVALTYDNDTGIGKLYVDGVNVSQGSLGGPLHHDGNGNTTIGFHYNAGAHHFNGTLDEVRIYDFALSGQQIELLYKNKTNMIARNETAINDKWSCQVTPTDVSSNGGMNESLNITIARFNYAPVINSVSILPSTAYRNNLLNATFNVDDGNANENLNVTTTWFTNNAINATYKFDFSSSPFFNIDLNTLYNNNSVGIPKDKIVQSQSWIVQINVSDGRNQTIQNSSFVFVLNRNPTFNETVGIINITHDRNLLLRINTSDLDGDNVTFADNTSLFNINSSGWIVDNPIQAETGKYHVNITIDDSFNTSTTAFYYIIENTVPNITAVNISPQPAYNNTDLQCFGTYTDSESDSESGSNYTWFKNDAAIDMSSSSTLDATNFTGNDVIICEYLPKDGLEFGLAQNSSGLTITGLNKPVIYQIQPTSGWQSAQSQFNVNISDLEGNSTVSTVVIKFTDPQNISTTNSMSRVAEPGNYHWRYLFTPTKAGNYTILVNATDTSSLTQNRSSYFEVGTNYIWSAADDFNLTNNHLGANATLYASVVSPFNLSYINLTVILPNTSIVVNHSAMAVTANGWDATYKSNRYTFNSTPFELLGNGTYNFYIELGNTINRVANLTGTFGVTDRWVYTPADLDFTPVNATDEIRFNVTLKPSSSRYFEYNLSITDYIYAANYTFSYLNLLKNTTLSNFTNTSTFYQTIIMTPDASIDNGTYNFNISINRRSKHSNSIYERTEKIPITLGLHPPSGRIRIKNGSTNNTCARSSGNCENLYIIEQGSGTTYTTHYTIDNNGGYNLSNCTVSLDGTLKSEASSAYAVSPSGQFNIAKQANQTITTTFTAAPTNGAFTGNLNITCLSANAFGDRTQALNDQRPFISLVIYSTTGGDTGGASGAATGGAAAKLVEKLENLTYEIGDGLCELNLGEHFENSPDDCSLDGICDAEHGESIFNSPDDCQIDLDLFWFGCFEEGQPCIWKESFVVKFLILLVISGLLLLFLREDNKKSKKNDFKERLYDSFKRQKFFTRK